MANCKDCLYVEVCKDFAINYLKTNNNAPMESLEKEVGDYPCCRFQDRSLFVKLPCKVGDTLYTIVTGNRIREWIVADISFFSYSVVKIVITADSKDNNGTDHMRFGKHYLNHSVFLSREAVEQALKEREENGNL